MAAAVGLVYTSSSSYSNEVVTFFESTFLGLYVFMAASLFTSIPSRLV